MVIAIYIDRIIMKYYVIDHDGRAWTNKCSFLSLAKPTTANTHTHPHANTKSNIPPSLMNTAAAAAAAERAHGMGPGRRRCTMRRGPVIRQFALHNAFS